MPLAVTGEFRVPSRASGAADAGARRRGVGLALAGGVMEGGFYEIGVLCALEEAIEGLDCTRATAYVGVSAGAVVSALLANGLSPHRIAESAVSRGADRELDFDPQILLTPAFGEYVRRAARIPGLVGRWIRRRALNPFTVSFRTIADLSELAPLGLFDNRPLERWLARTFATGGRTNDFRALRAVLRVIAVRLDTSELVAFGEPGMDHVPISRAVQASISLPGLYRPTEVDGEHYIDGVARRTLSASLALDEGVDILFCVNPIVPVDLRAGRAAGGPPRRPLAAQGLPAVLSQTLRTMVHSRMSTAFQRYEHLYPGADLVLIEPSMDDDRMFFSNIFSVANRREVLQHAYTSTRRHLRERADQLEPVLARHGLRLRREALADETRSLFAHLPDRSPRRDELDPLRDALEKLDAALARLSA